MDGVSKCTSKIGEVPAVAIGVNRYMYAFCGIFINCWLIVLLSPDEESLPVFDEVSMWLILSKT